MKSNDGFDIKLLFLAYVPPYSGLENNNLQSEVLLKQDRRTDFLLQVFDKSVNTCKTEINFISDGNKQNLIRNELLSLVSYHDIDSKQKFAMNLAGKLHKATDERGGNGLFIIIEGIKANNTRIVLIRFGGDEGLIRQGSVDFDVEYKDEIFTKRNTHNKITFYQDIFSQGSFWRGYAVDKQVTPGTTRTISYYWIETFLNSQLAITSSQGTLQFSKIVNLILKNSENLEEQEQVMSAILNLKNRQNYQISLSNFCSNYLNESLTNKILKEAGSNFFNSVFTIDSETYKKEFSKAFLSLHNGITAFIPTTNYEKYVSEKTNDDGSKDITIIGKLTSKKFNRSKLEKTIK